MRPHEEEPRLIRKDEVHGDTFDHPAFGQIGAARVNGQRALYGSDFEHHAFVQITIHRSELHRNLSRDWHFGHQQLIEVDLSEAQWAAFVSSMNVGGGVPCTLVRIAGAEEIPEIPLRREQEVVRQETRDHAAKMCEKVTATIAAIEGELGTGLSARKREAILGRLHSLAQDLRDDVPYHIDSFDKHVETTIEKAKIEVGAYVQSALTRAGLDALTGQGPLQLTEGKE